jgi:hypothetical protein
MIFMLTFFKKILVCVHRVNFAFVLYVLDRLMVEIRALLYRPN